MVYRLIKLSVLGCRYQCLLHKQISILQMTTFVMLLDFGHYSVEYVYLESHHTWNVTHEMPLGLKLHQTAKVALDTLIVL